MADKEPAADTVQAVIQRAYWDDQLQRHDEGEVVTVTKDALIAGMETGILAPFKG